MSNIRDLIAKLNEILQNECHRFFPEYLSFCVDILMFILSVVVPRLNHSICELQDEQKMSFNKSTKTKTITTSRHFTNSKKKNK